MKALIKTVAMLIIIVMVVSATVSFMGCAQENNQNSEDDNRDSGGLENPPMPEDNGNDTPVPEFPF
jgi:hypothetical protein